MLKGTVADIHIRRASLHDDPELYPDLVVRVTGFTAYFATLSPRFGQIVADGFLEGV